MSTIKVCYISGAYRNSNPEIKQKNIDKAIYYLKKYLRLGYPVICPHTNTGQDCADMEQEIDFYKMYLELLRRSDIIVMLPEWEQSEGAVLEHSEAIKLGNRIIYEKK